MLEKDKKIKKVLAFFLNIVYTTKVFKRTRKNNLRWLIGQGVKTPPSHGGNRGSIPLLAARKKSRKAIAFGDFFVHLEKYYSDVNSCIYK